MQTFYEFYNLKSLIKQPTCYKNPDKPLCIDFILTNVSHMFQSTCVIDGGLPDFHLMTVTVMRKTFNIYFSNETFRISPESNFSFEVYVVNDNGLEKFCKTTMDTLNKIVPTKKKPLMTKEL